MNSNLKFKIQNSKLLENTLGISFRSPELLTEALTHRSYLNENRKSRQSNERLEFLGDSILSLLTSEELFKRYPKVPEGKLTNLRSALVRAKTLGRIAQKWQLGEYLFMSRGEEDGGGRQNLSLLADAFEAILGAVYLDRGLAPTRQFLKIHLFPLIGKVTEAVYDYKSKLQEVIQEKMKATPTYQVISEEGPDHEKTFSVAAVAKTSELARGQGKSKQEAEQTAAKAALEKISSSLVQSN